MIRYFPFLRPISYYIAVIYFTYPIAIIIQHSVNIITLNKHLLDKLRIRKIKYFILPYFFFDALLHFMVT